MVRREKFISKLISKLVDLQWSLKRITIKVPILFQQIHFYFFKQNVKNSIFEGLGHFNWPWLKSRDLKPLSSSNKFTSTVLCLGLSPKIRLSAIYDHEPSPKTELQQYNLNKIFSEALQKLPGADSNHCLNLNLNATEKIMRHLYDEVTYLRL